MKSVFRRSERSIRARLVTTKLTVEALFRVEMGWLFPLVVILFLIGMGLAIIGQISVYAAFVYPLF